MTNKYVSILPPFKMIPDKTALILVDMQNFVLSKEHSWFNKWLLDTQPMLAKEHFNKTDSIVRNTKRILEAFRERDMVVAYFTVGSHLLNGKDILPMRREGAEYLKKQGILGSEIPAVGSKAHEIHEQLTPRVGEIVLNKTTRSGFTSTGINQILRNIGIEYIVMTGWASIACVNNSAIDAADSGYKVVVVEDACQCRKEESHLAFLEIFAENFGRVAATEDIIKEISGD